MAGKRFTQAAKLVDAGTKYGVPEAVALLKQLPTAKFTESVELAASLNVAVTTFLKRPVGESLCFTGQA